MTVTNSWLPSFPLQITTHNFLFYYISSVTVFLLFVIDKVLVTFFFFSPLLLLYFLQWIFPVYDPNSSYPLVMLKGQNIHKEICLSFFFFPPNFLHKKCNHLKTFQVWKIFEVLTFITVALTFPHFCKLLLSQPHLQKSIFDGV